MTSTLESIDWSLILLQTIYYVKQLWCNVKHSIDLYCWLIFFKSKPKPMINSPKYMYINVSSGSHSTVGPMPNQVFHDTVSIAAHCPKFCTQSGMFINEISARVAHWSNSLLHLKSNNENDRFILPHWSTNTKPKEDM